MSRTYLDVAAVIEGVRQRKGSAKSLTYRRCRSDNKPTVLKLVCETLRHGAVLEALASRCSLRAKRPALLKVMLFDLLFGRGGIDGGGAVRRSILKHEAELRAALGEPALSELVPAAAAAPLPRYARVNTLKLTVDEALAQLREAPFGARAAVDAHLPYVLALPASDSRALCAHALVEGGALILQDKASCFPPHELDRARRAAAGAAGAASRVAWTAIDACAAPGNKTSQLAALLRPSGGRVIAFDRSPERLELLRRRMGEAGASERVDAVLRDFLQTDPAEPEYADVRAVMLDPSCSGSGMRGQWGGEGAKAVGAERLEKLAKFQLSALLHAMSFPPVVVARGPAGVAGSLFAVADRPPSCSLNSNERRQVELITYSTCSVHVAENEAVVAAALAEAPDFALEHALPDWATRGVGGVEGLDEAQSACLVRADPEKDQTMGFFLASFRRTSGGGGAARGSGGGARKRRRDDGGGEEEEEEGGGGGEVDASEQRKKEKMRARRKKKKSSAKRRKRAKQMADGAAGANG